MTAAGAIDLNQFQCFFLDDGSKHEPDTGLIYVKAAVVHKYYSFVTFPSWCYYTLMHDALETFPDVAINGLHLENFHDIISIAKKNSGTNR